MMTVLTSYAYNVIELVLLAMGQQILIVCHAKIIVLFLEQSVLVIAVHNLYHILIKF
jgi:hypothetical protein